MIGLDEALRVVLERTGRLPGEEVPLEGAAGRWLREAVASDVDLPPADNSAMDGFALRSVDVGADGAELRVVGEIAAGADADFPVGEGEAARIMTGAPLPDGADAVQMVERTEPLPEDRVRVEGPVPSGQHVRRRGENLRRGGVILPAGQRLGPAELGLLAAAGRTVVPVSRAPRAVLLPTGDELVEPDRVPATAQIRNTNTATLGAQLRAEGVQVDYRGIVPDDPAVLDERIADGLTRDLLFLSGGVSIGKYDLVTDALVRAGVEILFEKVAIKPGKPVVFGVRPRDDGATLVFGLPGNPVSGMIVLRLLAAPAIRRMQGGEKITDVRATARLAAPLNATARREAFHPARIGWSDSGFVAEPLRHHGSGDLVAWRGANGLIRLPADQGAEPGDRVEILLDRDYDLR